MSKQLLMSSISNLGGRESLEIAVMQIIAYQFLLLFVGKLYFFNSLKRFVFI